jgi:hypothetical protein
VNDTANFAIDSGTGLITNSTFLGVGSYGLEIYATDASGNVLTALITVTVQYTQPSEISFVNPTPTNESFIGVDYAYINTTLDAPIDTVAWFDFDNDLVLDMSFEDDVTDGIVEDSSTYGNGGIMVNFAVNESVAAKFGQGLEFDGKDDYVVVGDSASLNITTNQITLMAWVKTDVLDGLTHTIISKETDIGGYSLVISTVNKPRLWIYVVGVGWKSASWAGSFSENTWYHVAGVYNGTNLKIYVNGTEEVGDAATGIIGSSPNNLEIGRNPFNAGDHFNGTIDEVRIWNRALSPEEINASFNARVYRLGHNFTNLAEGQHNVTAKTINEVGTKDKIYLTFGVDITPPNQPSPDDGVTGWSSNNTPTFSWTDPGDTYSGVAGYWYRVDSGEWSWTTNTSVTLPAQPDGNHTFYLKAQDSVGWNSTAGSHDFAIDTTGPTITSLLPVSNICTADRTPTFSATASDTHSGVNESSWEWEVYINGALNKTVIDGNSYTSDPLSTNDWIYVKVLVRDNLGTPSSTITSANYTVDVSGPQAVTGLIPRGGATVSTSTLSWNSPNDVGCAGVDYYFVEVARDPACSERIISQTTTGTSYTPSLYDGTYYWWVRAIDNFGNIGLWSECAKFVLKTKEPVVEKREEEYSIWRRIIKTFFP